MLRGWTLCSFDSQQGVQVVIFSKMSRLVLGPTWHPAQWVLIFLSPGIKPLSSSEVVSEQSNAVSPPCMLFPEPTLPLPLVLLILKTVRDRQTQTLGGCS
jgi:hypothetical protein